MSDQKVPSIRELLEEKTGVASQSRSWNRDTMRRTKPLRGMAVRGDGVIKPRVDAARGQNRRAHHVRHNTRAARPVRPHWFGREGELNVDLKDLAEKTGAVVISPFIRRS